MRRFMWLPLAAILVVALGAAAIAAVPRVANAPGVAGAPPASATDTAPGEPSPGSAGSTTSGDAIGSTSETGQVGRWDMAFHGGRGPAGLLEEVLAELVAEGVIDQEQADAIRERVRTLIEERHAGHNGQGPAWGAIRGILEDGVVTEAELQQLPARHPLRILERFLVDGEVSLEQLHDLFAERFGDLLGPSFDAEGTPWKDLLRRWFHSPAGEDED